MSLVSIHLLGGFGIVAGASAVALPTRKAQALLAILARRPGVPAARARLAGLLWPDRPDAQGRASLRQALASIRRALAPHGLPGPRARGDEVALDPAGLDVDVAAFERALAAGDLHRSLAEYRGPFLDGFPPVEDLFDDWAQAERSALAARTADVLRARLEAFATEDPAGALELAERALAVDPLLEAACRVRMRALAARGDRAGAVREYERCRAALARALGADPSDETQALRRGLDAAVVPLQVRARRTASVAVLPFEVLGSDEAAATLARGLTEDVCVELARFRGLAVIAHDSAARAAAAEQDAAAVGRALCADYVLAGSVRTGRGRLRLAARLVESATARQVWALHHDAGLPDVLLLEDHIAQAVVGALALGIDDHELSRSRERPPERLDAYECCVKGMASLRTGTPEGDQAARGLFLRALELDPTSARAHAGLSLAHFNDWSCAAWERWDENEAGAFHHAAEAVRLDPRDHLGHLILGRILIYRREFDLGAGHLERALALNASDADGLVHAATGQAYLGDPARGMDLVRTAQRLHPFHPPWYLAVLALNHFFGGDAREAARLFERAPDAFVDVRAFLAAAHAHAGEVERAREHARRFLARYRAAIASHGPPIEPVDWLLRVNPLRRAEDVQLLLDGLERTGVEHFTAGRGRAGAGTLPGTGPRTPPLPGAR